MKNYMEHFKIAAAKHLAFLADNLFVSALWGVVLWLLKIANVYMFNDYQFLAWLGLMMVYNGVSGVKKANYLHRMNPEANAKASAKVFADKTFSKIFYYMMVLNSVHILTHFQIAEKPVTIFQVFQYGVLVSMIATEFYSVHENYQTMGKKTFYEAIYKAVKDYLPTKKDEK